MSKINLDTLILYDNIRSDMLVQAAVKIFNEFDYHEYISYMEAEYYQIQRGLLETADDAAIEGTYWQNYICRLIAESENRFSLLSEKGCFDENIGALAFRETDVLKKLYQLEWERVGKIFLDSDTAVCSMKMTGKSRPGTNRSVLKEALEHSDHQTTVKGLREYYEKYGCGIFESYQAFVWDDGLVGVRNYDKITFEQLVGYDRQKEALIENTHFFIKNYKANNVLLSGDRGTGKSSGVKALLNRFADDKLKLISLNKNNVDHLYRIIEMTADRGCKFIIFIDDLSFDETELGYKHFKSVIDGGVEAQPSNILIYVTSNRRNIIKETWWDRGDNGEVHGNDGMQERLSLADRFGLVITYTAPDKKEYLEIVMGLAHQEGLSLSEERLTEEAIRWDARQTGRSGRSARQFVNHIHAKTMNRADQ